MDALEYVAVHLEGEEQRAEFLLKVLQSFVQQGIEGKRASDRRDPFTMKASSSSFSLGLLLPVLATVSVCLSVCLSHHLLVFVAVGPSYGEDHSSLLSRAQAVQGLLAVLCVDGVQ